MTEKVIILIDCGYFDYINWYAKRNLGKKIDLGKFSDKVAKGKQLIRTKIYHANPYKKDESPEEVEKYKKSQQFFYAINRIPKHQFVPVGRVRPIKFHCPKCKKDYTDPKQKGVDVAIALDLVKMAQNRSADIFILISGDEDLSEAVAMAQQGPCNVIIYYCYDRDLNMYGSVKLNNVASDRVNMDLKFLSECLMS